MAWRRRVLRSGWPALAMVVMLASTACNGLGGLGSVLGSPQQQQQQQGEVTGTVLGVNARAQQIGIQQSNGQTVTLMFDNRTQVSYQNQGYAVTALERGDEVTARIQSDNNGGYYTDLVQVNRSVSNGRGGAGGGVNGGENLQTFQGRVRQIDRNNGAFSLDAGDGSTVLVSLPYNVRRSDVDRFQNLRAGDSVRFYGVPLNNSRIELRQFY